MSDLAQKLDGLPVVSIPVQRLSLGFSPRTAGHDERHVRTLAELDRPWPPLLVHRQTYRVIDGMHRLLAARLRGDLVIEARLHDCAESDAFVLAVLANLTHGLPLSLSDRKAAARRIVDSQPTWSDRRIAVTTGLSDKTVAALRRTAQAPEGDVEVWRVGADGRSRPLDAASHRTMVTRLLRESPNSSLRQIASRAGVSPETVRSIRHKMEDGGASVASRGQHAAERLQAELDPRRYLEILAGDPALRSTDVGRALLRVLSTLALIYRDRLGIVEAIPAHDLPAFQKLAAANAEAWNSLAQLADERCTQDRSGRETADALL